MTTHVEVRGGQYIDSVSLMQVSAAVAGGPGVSRANVAMATELNLDLLAGMGFEIPAEASPNDLVVAIEAEDDDAVAAALAQVEAQIAAIGQAGSGAGSFSGEPAPRSAGWAVRRTGAPLTVVSVPGSHAYVQAAGALAEGSSVMIFSDNVPIEQEIALKDLAAERDLLVMGPDCGTAVVGGVGLGFANHLARGPVGVAAASGTGAQHLTSLLHTAGVGISHCLGLGGRDLSEQVAGRSARAALAALDADEQTEVIVLVSKPPHPGVAADLREFAAGLATPVLFALLGEGQPTITEAAEAVLDHLDRPVPQWPVWSPPAAEPAAGQPDGQSATRSDGQPAEQRAAQPNAQPTGQPGLLRGLFAGGTLCDEAMIVAGESLGPIHSNIPLHPDLALPADLRHDGHLMIDFGDDELTQGRPHPMIDGGLRLARIAEEATDPRTRVILLDVVLGYSAHENPAGELGPALEAALATARADGRRLDVVVSLCGTDADPQGLHRQAEALRDAGAVVHTSNAAAARFAADLVKEGA